jgi:Radical SAM superfamily
MAKGLLISYAGYPIALSSLFPDNGLASLAAVLAAEGDACQILDFNSTEVITQLIDEATRGELEGLLPRLVARDDASIASLLTISRKIESRGDLVADHLAGRVLDLCRREMPDFIGFKLWSGDGFEASIRIAQQIREQFPAVRLFAGGPAVHYGGQVVAAEAPVFDAVVDGEGEEAIIELARYAEGKRSLQGIPNVVNVDGAEAPSVFVNDLSLLPRPRYGREVYPAVWDGSKLRLFSIDESRGCPMRCAFCVNRQIAGGRWRKKTARQVLDEIAAHISAHRSRAFRLAGTYSPPALVRELCEGILKEELDITFGLFLHSRGMSDDLLALLKRAGCFGVFVGVESGSDAILERSMNKSSGVERLRSALAATMRHGLFTAASFIFPAPFETEETAAQTRLFIEEVFSGQENATVNVCFPGLIPRTLWWSERSRFGFSLEVDEEQYVRRVLRYKIKAMVPMDLWEDLPYTLNGRRQSELARETAKLQKWMRSSGIGVNLPDHDALVGCGLGYSPADFAKALSRAFFVGDGELLQSVVDRANEVFLP